MSYLIVIFISGEAVSRSCTESLGDPVDEVANGLLIFKLNKDDKVNVITHKDNSAIYGAEDDFYSYFQIMLMYNA